MSENGPNVAEDGSGGMSAVDVKFLITCLKNTTGGSISIDNAKVADELGYKNPRSVANRVALMKKKYELPIGTSGKGTGTPEKTPKAKDPAVPKTPSKQRVVKQCSTSGAKKKATPKNKSAKVDEDKTDDEDEDEDENKEVEEESVDEEAEKEASYEVMFPGSSGDEDEDQTAENEDENNSA